MTITSLCRYHDAEKGVCVGVIIDDKVYDITDHIPNVGAWLEMSTGRVNDAIQRLIDLASAANDSFARADLDDETSFRLRWLAPVDTQEVWAAGVTYERSRVARQEEAIDGGDVYARVYDAERPELFLKANGVDVIGHLGEVGVRSDATWSVPEPELTLVINPALEVVGFTIGNDMSSRDIEGANPLYLPQAKVYTASCAMGPAILLQSTTVWLDTTIHLNIQRDGATMFEESISTARIKRTVAELVEYLGRCKQFPHGAALMTGTGIVPPDDFTLMAGDVVAITIDGIGSLQNTVKVV
jgi:2-dehydro-3-deoxy-D-arabinonate dehydratase